MKRDSAGLAIEELTDTIQQRVKDMDPFDQRTVYFQLSETLNRLWMDTLETDRLTERPGGEGYGEDEP